MADFGITTPLVSIVLSVFMAGLALGSWGGGRARPAASTPALRASSSLLYASQRAYHRHLRTRGADPLLEWGRVASDRWRGASALGFVRLLSRLGGLDRPGPAAVLHGDGGNFPAGDGRGSGGLPTTSRARSFSYLYLANVLGAMAGAFGSAFVFIEWLGFARTLLVAAAVNGLIAAMAWAAGEGGGERRREEGGRHRAGTSPATGAKGRTSSGSGSRSDGTADGCLTLLFYFRSFEPGDGGGLDSPVRPVPGSGGLLLCHHAGGLSARDGGRFARLSVWIHRGASAEAGHG